MTLDFNNNRYSMTFDMTLFTLSAKVTELMQQLMFQIFIFKFQQKFYNFNIFIMSHLKSEQPVFVSLGI